MGGISKTSYKSIKKIQFGSFHRVNEFVDILQVSQSCEDMVK